MKFCIFILILIHWAPKALFQADLSLSFILIEFWSGFFRFVAPLSWDPYVFLVFFPCGCVISCCYILLSSLNSIIKHTKILAVVGIKTHQIKRYAWTCQTTNLTPGYNNLPRSSGWTASPLGFIHIGFLYRLFSAIWQSKDTLVPMLYTGLSGCSMSIIPGPKT